VALSVTAIAVRDRWIKHTYPGSAPLPERDPPPDNRWQRGDVVDALYLADSEETVWAEWYRHLAERMIPPLAQMPRELWTWQVDVQALADESLHANAAAMKSAFAELPDISDAVPLLERLASEKVPLATQSRASAADG
jgi:hypothetical protein